MDFETFVLTYLKQHKTLSVWWLSDFYEEACKNENLNFNDLKRTPVILRNRLRKLVKAGKIESRRTGTGWAGKSDFGCTNMNTYTLPGFWEA
jgi:hypothetical protein